MPLIQSTLVIAAVCFRDSAGRILTVRKRGTEKFMLPGGKLEPTESAREAAVREVGEEIGFDLDPKDLVLLGQWLTPAANEADTMISSTVFLTRLPDAAPRAEAEIAELAWLSPASAIGRDDLAPLLRDYVIPALPPHTSPR